MFRTDFLAPLLAAGLFPDLSQTFFFPGVPALDRARSLEYAFESAEQVFGQTSDFLRRNVDLTCSSLSDRSRPLDKHHRCRKWATCGDFTVPVFAARLGVQRRSLG